MADSQTLSQTPVALAEGQLWVDMDSQSSDSSRLSIKDFKSEIRAALSLEGKESRDQIDVVDVKDKGLLVQASAAEAVKEILSRPEFREKYPNAEVFDEKGKVELSVAPSPDASSRDMLSHDAKPHGPELPPELAAARAVAEPVKAEEPSAPPHPVHEAKAVKAPEADSPAVSPEVVETADKKGFNVKGAAAGAGAAAAIGAVSLPQEKGQSEQKDAEEPAKSEKKGRVLKIVGAALAIAIPVALIIRHQKQQSAAAGQGRG